MRLGSLATLMVVLAIAPALPGIATRTRAFLTGRRGAPVFQLYADLAKLHGATSAPAEESKSLTASTSYSPLRQSIAAGVNVFRRRVSATQRRATLPRHSPLL